MRNAIWTLALVAFMTGGTSNTFAQDTKQAVKKPASGKTISKKGPTKSTNKKTVRKKTIVKNVPPSKTKGSQAKTPVAPETYAKVDDPAEFGLHIEVQATLVRGTPSDDGDVEGNISSISVGGKELEVVSKTLDGGWVTTKKYGKIRVTGAYSGGLCFWLTPSQKTAFKKLLTKDSSLDGPPNGLFYHDASSHPTLNTTSKDVAKKSGNFPVSKPAEVAQTNKQDDDVDKLFKAGDLQACIKLLKAKTHGRPHDYDLWTNLGWVQEQVGDLRGAEATYIAYKDGNPRDPNRSLPLGQFYCNQKAYDKVPVLLEPVLNDPVNPNVYRILAGAYEKLSRLGDAERVWQSYVKSHPSDQVAQMGLTRVKHRLARADIGIQRDSELDAWNEATAAHSPQKVLNFLRNFPNSKRVALKEGVVAFSRQLDVSFNSNGNGAGVEQAKITVDGATTDWSLENGFELGLIDLASKMSETTNQNATVVRDAVDQHIVTVIVEPTNLFQAAQAGDLAKIKELLAKGVNVDSKDDSGWTPLMSAARCDQPDAVQLLLAAGANPNALDRNQISASMMAAFKGSVQSLRYLIKAGAVLTLMRLDGKTALSIAHGEGHEDCVKLIQDAIKS